jgi:hypothetical protein
MSHENVKLVQRACRGSTAVAVLAAFLLAAPAAQAGGADLAGQWHLDDVTGGTTPDSSGNGLTGTGVIGSLGPGHLGNALSFTNAGDGVDVADNALLRPNRMTVMAWVKHGNNPVPLQYRTLVGKAASGCSNRQYALDVGSTAGGLRFFARLRKPTGESDYVVTEVPVAPVWDGQWHAIAGTYDGATARLYADGVEISSAPVPAGFTDVDYVSPGDGRLSFARYVEPGAGCDQNGFQYKGAIDEVRIYNRALSASEIANPDAVPQPPASQPPAPVLGRSLNVEPARGVVFVSLPGNAAFASLSVPGLKGRRFVPLSEARQIPMGSLVDTRRGTVRITTARDATSSSLQSGEFLSGVFQVLQSRARSAKGVTELSLKGSSFAGCRSSARRTGTASAALSRRVVRRLRSRATGRFRTRGRYSAATVRGTEWVTSDRCDGTLTRVTRGTVIVRDFRRSRNITVRTGKSYLARAAG